MNSALFLNLFILSCSITFAFHEKYNVSKRIGGTERLAKEYPPYVVGVSIWWLTGGPFWTLVCMGTVISEIYVVTAKSCFKYYDKKVGIAHGNVHFPTATHYRIYEVAKHPSPSTDIALVKLLRPMTIASNVIPKLGKTKCPSEAQAVFHSWGATDKTRSNYTVDLHFSSVETISTCNPGKLCFKATDGTKIMNRDFGAGLIIGYGPGPTYNSDTHDFRLIGIVTPESRENIVAEEIYQYHSWIEKFSKERDQIITK